MTCFVTLPRVYRGLGSLVFGASINKLCCRCCCCCTCIEKDSQQFINLLLLHACNNCMVCPGLSYSCMLLRMCNAYVETGSFVLIYLVCLMYIIAMYLSVWSIYCMMHVLHCNIYIYIYIYIYIHRGIRNDCRGFKNLSYT